MTNTTPVVHPGMLIDVGVRHCGRLVIETTRETACDLAPSLLNEVEVVAAGTVQRLSYFAEVLKGGDINEALAHAMEVLRG